MQRDRARVAMALFPASKRALFRCLCRSVCVRICVIFILSFRARCSFLFCDVFPLFLFSLPPLFPPLIVLLPSLRVSCDDEVEEVVSWGRDREAKGKAMRRPRKKPCARGRPMKGEESVRICLSVCERIVKRLGVCTSFRSCVCLCVFFLFSWLSSAPCDFLLSPPSPFSLSLRVYDDGILEAAGYNFAVLLRAHLRVRV